MSVQLTAAMKSWKENREYAEKLIIERADNVLMTPNHCVNGSWSEFSYDMVLNDGIFDPFTWADTPTAEAYAECIGQNGNDDDECFFLSTIWCYVLMEKDPIKYQSIIKKILDISVNGL